MNVDRARVIGARVRLRGGLSTTVNTLPRRSDGGARHAYGDGMAVKFPRTAATLKNIGFILAGVPFSLLAPTVLTLSPLLLRHKIRSTMLGGHELLAGAAVIIGPIVLDLACVPALSVAQRWRLSTFGAVEVADRRSVARGVLVACGTGLDAEAHGAKSPTTLS